MVIKVLGVGVWWCWELLWNTDAIVSGWSLSLVQREGRSSHKLELRTHLTVLEGIEVSRARVEVSRAVRVVAGQSVVVGGSVVVGHCEGIWAFPLLFVVESFVDRFLVTTDKKGECSTMKLAAREIL